MTQKRKGQGKKSKIKGLSKRVLQPSGEQLSPPGQVSRAKSGENSLNNTNQDMIESAEDDGSERAESGPNVVVQNKQVVVSDEASTSLGSPERVADEQEQELELGLSQVASFLKDNSVLSPLAPVFQSNSNIGKQAASHVNVTRTARAWEKPTQTTNFEDNGAGVTSALDSKWAERFRELEELEINRREELNKQMREARLKLEKEMHQARIEHEMAMKKREIQRRRDELRKLEEEVFGNDIEHQLSDRESSNAREPDKNPVQQPSTPIDRSSLSQRLAIPPTGNCVPQESIITSGTGCQTQQSLQRDNSSQLQYLLEKQQITMDEVVKGLRMPQREYMSFDGEPRNFPLFMKNFEVNVESKESNDADRLNYLIQYCKGTARQAIEHCIIMPPDQGYKRAKEILRKNFGRNHIVTQAFLEKVLNGPPIRVNEAEKLSQLARDMETCLLGSIQLGNRASINSMDTLGRVVSRLPMHLKSKWADKASHMYDNHITPDFSHLTEFIQSRAAVASTYFGQMITSKNETRKDGTDRLKKKSFLFSGNSTNLATHSQRIFDSSESKGRNLSCVLCKGTHHLERCHKFRAQNLQQRQDLVKTHKVCHACLSPGHFVKDCRGARICGVEGCQRRHHPLLHSSEIKAKDSKSSERSNSNPEPSESDSQSKALPTSGVGATNSSYSSCRIGLQVIPVKVSAPYGSRVIETYAFLDSGSNTTMCLTSLAEDLGADCSPIEFTLATVSGSHKSKGQQLSLDVVGVSTGKGVRLDKVWTTNTLPVALESIPTNTDVKGWSHLKGVNLTDLVDKKVTILIGSDVPEALCPLEVRSGKRNQPYAIRTILGWTVMGPLKGKPYQEAQMNFIHVDQALGCMEREDGMSSIRQQLQNLYNSEFSESAADVKECLSVEDRRAKAIMDRTVKLENHQYEIGLPWKYDDPLLPYNKSMAERRLAYLKKRLERDPILHANYKATMKEYISKGHAKVVQVDKQNTQDESLKKLVWYLPHHPVTHPQKPEKTRIVLTVLRSSTTHP
ncbi:uncharacterized protein LOC124449080 [Xenia sp. Carnegie-2017]|uniref:uncharacterized protein LOC124449080 n=1 Tax=Xenia sp. Carnegie-2017 TaxID=2897299 RepID=UPI001F0369A8|nr:uncharacterized protein LOC124449080 [Xenia sp. Carnegie-2017]